MSAVFNGAHPTLSAFLLLAAVAIICAVAIYVFTHDDRR